MADSYQSSFIDDFYNKYVWLIGHYRLLQEDIYPQPEDEVHAGWAADVINSWMPLVPLAQTVLDVGCGQAFVQPLFEQFEKKYTGVTIGGDAAIAKEMGRNVLEMDYNFLDFPDDSFDLIFSRHSLEHSPFPLLTLMEWHRVAKSRLILVLPNPEYWGWAGRNHYSVMHKDQAKFLLQRAGFSVLLEDNREEKEFRFLCEKSHETNV